MCQFCLKLFKKVCEIEVHLKKVHHISRWYFPSSKMFTNYAGHAYSFICSICNDVIVGKVKKRLNYKLGTETKLLPYEKNCLIILMILTNFHCRKSSIIDATRWRPVYSTVRSATELFPTRNRWTFTSVTVGAISGRKNRDSNESQTSPSAPDDSKF